MSDQQKIWFIYLTDHHEGPFTSEEVGEKIGQGVATPQSLGWKDGMPEWLPIESIPELSSALSAPTAAPAAGAGAGEEGFSLAQMLASQQTGSAPVEPAPAAAGLDFGDADSQPEATLGAAPVSSEAVDPADQIWTMRVGDQVSGLYSLQQLIGMASQGEVPANAMLWHSGWIDFQPIANVPEVASSRQAKRAGSPAAARSATNSGINRPRPFAPITAAADVGSDDPTDPGIKAPRGGKAAGYLAKLKSLFSRAPKSKPAGRAVLGGRSAGPMASLRRIAPILGGLLIVGGGAFAYFQFFSSPLPSDLDVLPGDLEAMIEVVKQPAEQGARLFLSHARGTEDNPADATAPKYYVATNLPAGSSVTLAIAGHPGTLVNRPSFEKTFTAQVSDHHLAVFEDLKDDGKPLPMGEYTVKVAAEGAEPLILEKFIGGNKGAVYTSRLNKYKEKLQADYDKEMQALREYIDTLKSLQSEVSRHLHDYNTGWQNPGNRTKIVNEWRAFSVNGQNMAAQIDQKVRAYTGSGAQIFQPRAFQDISTTLNQILQLIQIHGERLAGKVPTSNPNDLDGLTQAGVQSLDQWLAQAIVKSPFDVLNGKPAAAGATAAAPATAAPAAAAP